MSRFDGSDEKLDYGHALLEVVERCSWPSEAHRDEVRAALAAEHNIAIVAATPAYQDSRDQTISQYEDELVQLRKEKAERERQAKEAADLAELEALRAERDATTTPAPTD